MVEKNTNINEEQLISSLKEMLMTIKTQENPEELNKYRRIFKKAVPLTMRSYVAAYLIKNAGTIGTQKNGSKKSTRGKDTNESFRQNNVKKASRPKIILPEDVSTSLFIGIGRKRGVFPKDIITLLIQGADIEREHIGDIRILDNYCFVQVMENEASTIIEKLNNSYYRGKSLTVSHSRKPEEADSSLENNDNEDSDIKVEVEMASTEIRTSNISEN